MIEQGYQMDFSKETFGVILYGPPGIGKTTTALSDGKFGADTLLINLERGASRVRGVHYALASVLTASTYEEVLRAGSHARRNPQHVLRVRRFLLGRTVPAC